MTYITNQRLAKLAGVGFRSEEIKLGTIVYSRTHTIVPQFKKLAEFPECVLITSFSDDNCTDEMADKLPFNVKKWFSNNVSTDNPRVIGVPIGLRTSNEIEMKIKEAEERGRLPDQNLVYMNFWRKIANRRGRGNPRNGLYKMFEGKKWVTTEGGYEHVSIDHFYKQVISHPYILSPPGAGPDCHRHWEAILLGSIPIVQRSPVTKILDGLPCLQVNNWSEVNEEMLLGSLPRLKKLFKSPRMEICKFEYWKKKILGVVNVS
ncbi:MAG: hypothetical protein ACTSO3_01250 [Candidatus Heimdallarchaeaceae archaeon]